MRKQALILSTLLLMTGISSAFPTDIDPQTNLDLKTPSIGNMTAPNIDFDSGFEYTHESNLINFTSSEQVKPDKTTNNSSDNSTEESDGSSNSTDTSNQTQEQETDDMQQDSDSGGDYIIIDSEDDVVEEPEENKSIENQSRSSESQENDEEEIEEISDDKSERSLANFPANYWRTQDSEEGNSITGDFSNPSNWIQELISMIQSLFSGISN